VLHLELDLMHLEIVDEALAIGGARSGGPPLELFELANQLQLGQRFEVSGHGAPCSVMASNESNINAISPDAGISLPPTLSIRSPPSGEGTRSSRSRNIIDDAKLSATRSPRSLKRCALSVVSTLPIVSSGAT